MLYLYQFCDYFLKKKCIVLELFILNIPFKVLVINSHNDQGHECHSEHLQLPWSSHLLTFIFGKISFCTWYLNRHFHPVRSFKYYFLPLMIICWNVYFKGSWNCLNEYIMNFVIYIMSIPLIHSLNPTALRTAKTPECSRITYQISWNQYKNSFPPNVSLACF